MGSSAMEAVTQGYAFGEAAANAPLRRKTQELELQKLGMEVSNIQDTLERQTQARKMYEMSVKPDSTALEKSQAYADAMLSAGFFEAGFEALKTTTDQSVQKADLAIREKQAINEDVERVAATFANVRSREDYEARWDMLAMIEPEIMQQPGFAELRDTDDWQEAASTLVDYAISMKEKSEIEENRARAEAARASAARDRFEMENVMPARIETELARQDNLRKVGTADSKEFKARVKLASDAIFARYQTGGRGPKDSAAARVLGNKAAILATDYLTEYEDLSEPEAVELAISDLEKAGEFAGMRRTRRGTGSRESPLDLSEVDLTTVSAGTWVKNKAGGIGFYDGEDILTVEEYQQRQRKEQ